MPATDHGPRGPNSRRPGPRSPGEQLLLWTVVLGVSMGGFLRLNEPAPVHRTPDEVTYAAYADTLVKAGVAVGTRRLVEAYNGDPSHWIYPPPTRVGYTVPLALATRLRGDATAAAVGMSRLASVLGLVFAALLAWRFVGPWGALFTTLLFAASPVDMVVARRVWQDGLVGAGTAVLLTLMLLLVDEREGQHGRWHLVVGFGLVGAWLTTVKENGVGILLLVLVAGSAAMLLEGRRRRTAETWVATAVALSGTWLIVMWLVGGPGPFVEIYRNIGSTLPSVPYNIEYQSGTLTYGLEGIWLLSPFSATCFLLGLVHAVTAVWRKPASRRARLPVARLRRHGVLMALGFFAILFVAAVGVPPYLKNLRFATPALVPMYVVAGAGLVSLIQEVGGGSGGGRPHRWVLTALLCLALVGANMELRNYRRTVATNGFPDLTLPFIKEGVQGPATRN